MVKESYKSSRGKNSPGITRADEQLDHNASHTRWNSSDQTLAPELVIEPASTGITEALILSVMNQQRVSAFQENVDEFE